MRIVRHLQHCPESMRHCVVALGNFDGVHQGHQAVIKEALAVAERLHAKTAVMTFEPHPLHFFRTKKNAFRIEPFREKARHLRDLGVDVLFVPPFDASFSQLPAEIFIRQTLVGQVNAQHIVTGENFIFGHRRSGNVALMQAMAKACGFGFTAVPPVIIEGEVCSSTKVRECLQQGDMRQASQLLGRPYALAGRVRHGEGQGKALGFPTANIALRPGLLRPALGVYAVHVMVEGEQGTYAGVANLGKKPTFGTFEERLEVHLFDWENVLYGKRAQVHFVAYLRPERKFESVETLVRQINEDIRMAKDLLAQKEERQCS